MSNDGLAEAINDYCNGSQSAFKRIVSLTHEDLRLFAAVRLPTAELYEEALQRVYIAAFEQFAKGVQPDRPLAWLRGIARHVCADIHRERYRGERTLAPLEALLIDESAGYINDDYREGSNESEELSTHATITRQHLDHCLAKLSSKARKMMHEAYINELPHKRMAQMFKMKAANITTFLFRTRKSLRNCLAKQGVWEQSLPNPAPENWQGPGQ